MPSRLAQIEAAAASASAGSRAAGGVPSRRWRRAKAAKNSASASLLPES